MRSFEDVYLIPNVGAAIHGYLSTEDEARMDSTSNEIRAYHREWVYPMHRTIDIDKLYDGAPTFVASKYLTKMSRYVEHIHCRRNECGVKLPRITCLPKLKTLTFAVPTILDTTLRRLHPNTHMLWSSVDTFLASVLRRHRYLEKIHIIPGVVILARTDVISGDYLEEHILEDTTEGSHLQIFRRFQMPVHIIMPYHAREIDIKFPFQLASLASKNLGYTDWSVHETGIASVLLDLLD